ESACPTTHAARRRHECRRGTHECVRHEELVIFGLRMFRLQGLGGDRIFPGRPVGQVDHAAALATERKAGVAEIDIFFADGTIHMPIWTSCGSIRGAGSVEGSSVPTTS